MSNETFWAIKRRQRAAAAARNAPPVVVKKVVEAPPDEEDVPYRDLQAQAKALEIPANQSREELEAAIAEAGEE